MIVDAREEKNGIHKMQEILNIIYNCKWLFLEIIFLALHVSIASLSSDLKPSKIIKEKL